MYELECLNCSTESADCMPMYVKGTRGALFKVRLSSHGNTFVAKGMEEHNTHYLKHEEDMYNHLRPLQGTVIPVCLGSVDLKLPYYYDHGQYTRMLFLSWGGRPIFSISGTINRDISSWLWTQSRRFTSCKCCIKMRSRETWSMTSAAAGCC